MIRRILAFVLLIALLLTTVVTFAYADGSELEAKNIQIDLDGTIFSQRVYESREGTLFAPVTMLTQCGKMLCIEGNSSYIFYNKFYDLSLESELDGGEGAFGGGDMGSRTVSADPGRQIHIEKSGDGAQIIFCDSNGKTSIIDSVAFSDSHNVDEVLYLPLVELLPLFDAKVEITEDGLVHIYRNPVPLYSALYAAQLDDCVFDVNEMVAGGFISASGLVVDSILNFRFDRLDMIAHSGAIKDYSVLFKKFLADNETYLSAFDEELNPGEKYLKHANDSIGDFDDQVGGIKDGIKLLNYMFTSSKGKPLLEDLVDFTEIIETGADVAEGVGKVFSYYNAYLNQVDDHREMLNAVYGGENYNGKPASIAANEVYTRYGAELAELLISTTSSALREYVVDKIASGVVKGFKFTPYKIAFSVVKLVLPDMTETWSDAADLYFLANIIQDSYDVTNTNFASVSFDQEMLNDLRLSLLMTLVASKYGYSTYYSEDSEEVKIIDKWLQRLYLAADSVDCVSKGYYAEKKEELQKHSSVIHTEKLDNEIVSPDDEVTKPDDEITDVDDEVTKDLNTIFKNALDLLDVAHDGELCVEYIVSEVMWHLDVYDPDTDVRVSAEVFEAAMNLYFYIDDDMLQSVRDFTEYDAETKTYRLNYYSCAGGYSNSRAYKEYVCNGNTYDVFYEHVTYVYLEDAFETFEEYMAFEEAEGLWVDKWVVEYNGYIYECSVEGYRRIESYDKYGKKYTVEYNNGIVRLLACADYDNRSPSIDTTASEGLEITVHDGYCSVDGIGICTDADIVIPATYNGWPVTVIGENAFSECSSLTNVILPEGVVIIGKNAFSYCSNLKTVRIPSSVTQIGESAFYCCTSLICIDIPGSVETIGFCAFYSCKSLSKVTFDKNINLTKLEDYVFGSCERLEFIEIPDSVINIGYGAFFECRSIENIVIPEFVTHIGCDAFASTGLTSVKIPASITSMDATIFYNCGNLTCITFEGTVEQWNAINKDSAWNLGIPATEVICSDGTVELED